jgi:hypothetical protein
MTKPLYTVWFVPTKRGAEEFNWKESQVQEPTDHEHACLVAHELRTENLCTDFGLFGKYEVRPVRKATAPVR